MVDDANEDDKAKKERESKIRPVSAQKNDVQQPPVKGDQGPSPETSFVSDAETGAISHPSVAAIVPATPGGPASPDRPNILVHARKLPGDIQTPPTTIPAFEETPRADFQLRPVDEEVKPVGQEQLERSERNERTLGHIIGGITPPSMQNPIPTRPAVVPGVGFNNNGISSD